MQEHHRRMRCKTLKEGIQQPREVAVLEVLFGRGRQHENDPDKVRCTGQMLWNVANLGPSQYTSFIATINADSNQETVSSVANKLRNFESMISVPMQAHVSAVVKELKEEFKEEMREIREEVRKINAAPVIRQSSDGPLQESKVAKWYTAIDIANAFFSIPLVAECRPQFAFTWRSVKYSWKQLLWEWKHSPTICHGLIQAAMGKGEAPEHLQYIDDIIVWGNTAMEVQ
ncbi:hypothetical protein TURU_138170 [Turdus rufiventris]|nr:hypothetical protein TURU_138170 [Turdus rufiventris]